MTVAFSPADPVLARGAKFLLQHALGRTWALRAISATVIDRRYIKKAH
jgi:hypothetical protein